LPLATTAVEPSPSKLSMPLRSPRSRAHAKPTRAASLHRNRSCHCLLPRS
jgi:hypothetical protein